MLEPTKFTVVFLSLAVFLAAVVGILAVIGPSGALSIIYLLFSVVFATGLFNLIKGKTYPAGTPLPKRPAKKWIFLATLLNSVGGVVAFSIYWLVRDHLVSATVLSVFVSLALLVLILSGSRIAQ